MTKTQNILLSIILIIISLASIVTVISISRNTKSRVTIEITDPRGFPLHETVAAFRFLGSLLPSDKYTPRAEYHYSQTSETGFLTFKAIPRGSYVLTITHNRNIIYNNTNFKVNQKKLSLKVEVQPRHPDLYFFADREWLVLDVQEDKALLISHNTIDIKHFLLDNNENSWKNNEIREYLNSDFFQSFNDKEKDRVLEHPNGDKVFLLSVEEAQEYFRTDVNRRASGPRLHYRDSSWWLRSFGYYVDNRGAVVFEGEEAYISTRIIYPDTSLRFFTLPEPPEILPIKTESHDSSINLEKEVKNSEFLDVVTISITNLDPIPHHPFLPPRRTEPYEQTVHHYRGIRPAIWFRLW